MTPPSLTPERAESYMKTVTKYDDPDLLNAVLYLVLGVSGLDDAERDLPGHVSQRDNAARAALSYGYRKTPDCDRHCEAYLGIAV